MHYYRCLGCLLVVTVTEQLRQAQCDVCQFTRFEHMGRVHNNRLVEDGVAPPCDARCTNAAGPECNCQCHSANHGSGMLVDVIIDQGAVPRLKPNEVRRAKHRLMFDEFQQAKSSARQAANDLLNSGWVSDKKLWIAAKYGIDRVMRECDSAKTQTKRLKLLKEFEQYLTGARS